MKLVFNFLIQLFYSWYDHASTLFGTLILPLDTVALNYLTSLGLTDTDPFYVMVNAIVDGIQFLFGTNISFGAFLLGDAFIIILFISIMYTFFEVIYSLFPT